MSRDAWQNLGLATLAALTVAGVVWLFTSWPPEPPPTPAAVKFTPTVSAPAQPAPAEDEIVFVGDSYTDALGAVNASGGYAPLAAQQLGMDSEVFADSGAGYLTRGVDGDTMHTLVADQPADRTVDAVVVASGFNDVNRGWTMEQIRRAADRTWDLAQARWPNAELVVVGPWLVTDRPEQAGTQVRDTIRAEAREAGLTFVDAYDWGSKFELGQDRIHPTPQGHVTLARLVAADLRGVLG